MSCFRLKEPFVVAFFIVLIEMLFLPGCHTKNVDDTMQGKVAVITGTSSGLGKAMAEIAAKKKMKIILVDINLPPSENLAQAISQKGGEAVAIQVDLANPEERGQIIDLAMKKFGRIDYLINNAGYLYAAKVEDLSLKQAHRLFEVNFWAYLDLANRVIPIMKKQGGGNILNVASIFGFIGWGYDKVGIYKASKHALIGIFEVMSSELKDYNINVKVACPAGIKTNIFKNAIGPEKEAIQEEVKKIWDDFDSPETVAEDIFNKLNQKEFIILPARASSLFKGVKARDKRAANLRGAF